MCSSGPKLLLVGAYAACKLYMYGIQGQDAGSALHPRIPAVLAAAAAKSVTLREGCVCLRHYPRAPTQTQIAWVEWCPRSMYSNGVPDEDVNGGAMASLGRTSVNMGGLGRTVRNKSVWTGGH